jgi:hypothetical protein
MTTPMDWALTETLNRRIDELERALAAEKLVSSVMQERAEVAEAESEEWRTSSREQLRRREIAEAELAIVREDNSELVATMYRDRQARQDADAELGQARYDRDAYKDKAVHWQERALKAEVRVEVLEAAAQAINDWELTVRTMGRRLTAAEQNMATMVKRLGEFG